MNALVIIETITPAIFTQQGGIDAMLLKLEADVRAVATDISTPAGRKAVASLAHKVARSKTAFDQMGKDLVSGWKEQAKAVDKERARVWDRLETLQAEVRKPLDEYEAAEAQRIADHQSAIQGIIDLGTFAAETPASADAVAALTELESLPARDWQEFKQKAAAARSDAFAKLQAIKSAALVREAQAAELARLRAEQVEREQRARDERIAAEASAKATQEAEARAAAEARRVADEAAAAQRKADQARADAVAQAERVQRAADELAAKAVRDAIESKERAAAAAIKAAQDQEAAVEAERLRLVNEAAAAADAEAKATARREADKAHRKAVNNEAKAALVAAGLSEPDAIKAITAIALGQVPRINISY